MKRDRLSKIFVISVAAMLGGFKTHASIVLLSDDASASVSGTAAGLEGCHNFSQSQDQPSSSPVASYNTLNVSGGANWTDSTSQTSYADGEITLQTEISDSSIYAQNQMHTDASPAAGGSYGSSCAQGESRFEFSFLVQTPQQYNLNFSAGGSVYIGEGNTMLNLTDPDPESSGQYYLGDPNDYTFTGVLNPGNYTVIWDATISAGSDPDPSASGLYDNINFSVSPVPDVNYTLALLLIPLGILARVRFLQAQKKDRQAVRDE